MTGYATRLLVLLTYLGLIQTGLAIRRVGRPRGSGPFGFSPDGLFGITHGNCFEPEYVLVATEQEITTNCHSRKSIVFNGTSPGPAIHLTEGQTTWIRVYNNIGNDNLTVHWHGLSQRTAPFSDGTPMVAQWPIAPGEFFDYEIHPEVGDAGTYFYHSHVGFQAVTAHGTLIVDSATHVEPYQYDDDIVLMFSDHYEEVDSDLKAGLLANPFKWSGEPLAVNLNERSGNATFANAADDSCKPYVLTVQPGKTYRLRFIGGTAISFVTFGIEGHSELTVIEADGQYTKPVTTDHIQVGPGQRFSALLKTKTQAELDADGKSTYWIRYETLDRPTTLTSYAVLQYDTDKGTGDLPQVFPDSSPITLTRDASQVTSWLEYKLESLVELEPFPTAAEVTRTVYVQVSQHIIDGFYDGSSVIGKLEFQFNGLTWTEQTPEEIHLAPYLVEAYTTGRVPNYEAALANKGWDPATRAFPARVGETLDIVWVANSGPTGGFDTHPMHGHGAHYWDLGSGNGTYNAAENEKHFAQYTPAKRDTTQLYKYMEKAPANYTNGWRAWRLRVTEENVGAWQMHCHILPHIVMGMSTVWVFGNAAEIVADIPEPYITGYLEYGGSAYGNATYDPLVVPYFGQAGKWCQRP